MPSTIEQSIIDETIKKLQEAGATEEQLNEALHDLQEAFEHELQRAAKIEAEEKSDHDK